MGLFNIFNRKPPVPRIDLVWMTAAAKDKGTLDYITTGKPDFCIAWFDDTRDRFQRLLNEENSLNIEIKSGASMQPYHLDGKHALFLEHYPLYSKEEKLFTSTGPVQATFFSSLDDLIFRLFGSNIAKLMRSMGMDENSPLENPLISKSIIGAQKRLEKKVRDDFYVRSGEEWLQRYTMMFGKEK